MNTEYVLFGPDGPRVNPEKTHWGRLDEMAKCLAVSPADAVVRLFWADAMVTAEGPDLGTWMNRIGRKAPSEQQMSKFLWPNIKAAGHGEDWTLRPDQAAASWDWDAGDFQPNVRGQPTPGIFVHRSALDMEDRWDPAQPSWPTRPTAKVVEDCLRQLRRTHDSDAMGLLLDYDGVDLRCFGTTPVVGDAQSEPQACVTILGGPKGISQPFKAMLRSAFRSHAVPLLEVCLGPEQQMAHACVAHLRLEADAGRLHPALMDLLSLGRERYEKLYASVEATLRKKGRTMAAATASDALRKSSSSDAGGAATGDAGAESPVVNATGAAGAQLVRLKPRLHSRKVPIKLAKGASTGKAKVFVLTPKARTLLRPRKSDRKQG